ncbi:MAG: hypothetical protein JXB85_08645 [Anaerolineales bacterium]|nr:hypothetical protein [Anaerolineales bacterium]
MEISSAVLARLESEPALAWKLAAAAGAADSESARVTRACQKVREAPLVRQLLATIDDTGRVYKKWDGAHWVLSLVADLGYPPGEAALRPLMSACYQTWLGKEHARHIRVIAGRTRRCASQEGNAVWYSLRLGLADGRTEELVSRLLGWQWPDGGWNCDKRPEADTSSFMETLIPLRALALYARVSGAPQAAASAERAAEVFLRRCLFRRHSDGQVMDPHFVRLHYPPFWHYDILFGLKVIAEAGFLADPRCREALDLLESKRLPDGGFPAEEAYTRPTRPELSGYSPIDWGGTSKVRLNPFVTAEALAVLKAAGR